MRSQVSKCSSIFSRIANNCCLKLRITDAVMKTSDDGKMFFMYCVVVMVWNGLTGANSYCDMALQYSLRWVFSRPTHVKIELTDGMSGDQILWHLDWHYLLSANQSADGFFQLGDL